MDRYSSMMIWQKASQFLEAANIVRHHGPANLFSPVYFLAGQAIELALKGFHRGHGDTECYLKKTLGHDLDKALSAAEAEGFRDIVFIEWKDREYVAALNDHYLTKYFQYTKQGHVCLPHIDELLALADKLVMGVKGYCEANRKTHDGKPTAVQ